ncbi:MAG TPA: hypothetical protein VGM52_16960 [Herbaspirillum sp.]|jgi:SAM-dependent methyltransferase
MEAATKSAASELRSLLQQHNKTEKHIGYHILPERLNAIFTDDKDRNKYTFYERERFAFFCDNVDFKSKRVLDIGCNIGYFLFGFLDIGAKNVTGYEGKLSCGQYLNKAIQITGEEKRFDFHNEYLDFQSIDGKYDVTFLLNVLHHLGDDYGNQSLDIASAKKLMMEQLNALRSHTSTLIFQLGFNWKGNRNVCLFEHGTKAEMIQYITEGTRDHWDIKNIGIAQRVGDGIVYAPVSDSNIERDDSMGEFLNRPIFVLQSKG